MNKTGRLDESMINFILYGNQDLSSQPDNIPKPSDPITDLADIERLKDYFLNSPKKFFAIRNYTIFCFGISTSVRSSDILNLKVSDVVDNNNNIRDEVVVKRSVSTNGTNDTIIIINQESKQILFDYLAKRNTMKAYKVDNIYYDYLFPSQKTSFWIDSSTWSTILKKAGKDLNLPYNLGCDSMRKTYVYWQVAEHFKTKFQTEQDKKIDKILAAINNGATIVSKEELIELLNE